MQAAIFDKFCGTEVLEVAEVEKPRIKSDEVLVQLGAAAINPKDTFVRKGRFRLFTGRRFTPLRRFGRPTLRRKPSIPEERLLSPCRTLPHKKYNFRIVTR